MILFLNTIAAICLATGFTLALHAITTQDTP